MDFQILSRNARAPFNYERGPKDVVYVGEGKTVRLLIKFEHHRGRYMIHCNNPQCKDHDMMAQFSISIDTNEQTPVIPSRRRGRIRLTRLQPWRNPRKTRRRKWLNRPRATAQPRLPSQRILQRLPPLHRQSRR